MRLVGYARVSTENQKEAETIEIQRAALLEYAELNGHTLVEIFSDNGLSGAKDLDNRPGLSEMFDYLESQTDLDGVLIYKLDRLARDLYIQEHLLRKLQGMNRALVSVKEPDICSNDPMRKAFRQFMGIVSELEKAFITMRLSGGRINKARKGGFAGGCPGLGYRAKDKQLSIDAESSETVRMIFSLRNDLDMSLRDIAQLLNESGIPTARNGKWYAGTVKYILDNPVYKGIIQYSNIRVNNKELALV
jgi:site-specific DNA recombinase